MRPIRHACALLLLPLLAVTSCQNPTESALRNEGSGEVTSSTGKWSVSAPSIEHETIAVSTWLSETDEPIEVEEQLSIVIEPVSPPPAAVPEVADVRNAHIDDVALAWLERSARTGSIEAQTALSLLLRRSNETSYNPAQASMWFELAEEQRAASEPCGTEARTPLGKGKRSNWFTRTTDWSNPTAQHHIRSLGGN